MSLLSWFYCFHATIQTFFFQLLRLTTHTDSFMYILSIKHVSQSVLLFSIHSLFCIVQCVKKS